MSFQCWGSILAISALGLTWYWYDWRLALLMFLLALAHNLERHHGGEG